AGDGEWRIPTDNRDMVFGSVAAAEGIQVVGIRTGEIAQGGRFAIAAHLLDGHSEPEAWPGQRGCAPLADGGRNRKHRPGSEDEEWLIAKVDGDDEIIAAAYRAGIERFQRRTVVIAEIHRLGVAAHLGDGDSCPTAGTGEDVSPCADAVER